MAGKNTKTQKKQRASTSKADISKDEILKAEFDYAANSAFQANEDRSKVASFFLVSVGSLAAAILTVDRLSLSTSSYIGLAGLFVVLTLLGVLTVMQLARLRQAWIESAKVMNSIKDHYIRMYPEAADAPNRFEDAFRWRTKTIPLPYKTESVSYYTVLEVAFLSGLTLGAAVFFLLIGVANGGAPVEYIWWLTGGAGAFAFLLDLVIYKRSLPNEPAVSKESK